MPTFAQSAFLGRAAGSLVASNCPDWELVIVDDASPDETPAAIRPWLADERIRSLRLPTNVGLGAALNVALSMARAPVVAYLPSDDVYLPEHLGSLLSVLDGDATAVAAFADLDGPEISSVASGHDREGPVPLQLVQMAHRVTGDRWVERTELVTDDLDRLFWGALAERGAFVGSGEATCQWVEHPGQLSRAIRESTGGGLNPFRHRYQVSHPLRFQSTEGDLVDEHKLYDPHRNATALPPPANHHQAPMNILLVGELAYNPDRVLLFEDHGHRLYGLWTPDGWFFNTVGPLPFGSIEDIPAAGWIESVRRLRPDVIYALLNWQAVPFAHSVLVDNPGVPFVWHFKEGPWACIDKGTWPKLVDLCTRAHGVVFSSPEQQAWFEMVLPDRLDPTRCLALDGDLPHGRWFDQGRSTRLSETDGEIHTAVFGRPMGIDPAFVGELSRAGIHIHFHGLVRSEAMTRQWAPWLAEARRLAPDHFHLEPTVAPSQWSQEASRYDGGWLHVFGSSNQGDLRQATWDDLNYPARLSTMAAGGLPLLYRASPGCTVAVANLSEKLGIGVPFTNVDGLASALDRERLDGAIREKAWAVRREFTFDAHVDRLVDFFRTTVDRRAPLQGTERRRSA